MPTSERTSRGLRWCEFPTGSIRFWGGTIFILQTTQGSYIRLAMPGQFYRSKDGLCNWEVGPRLFD